MKSKPSSIYRIKRQYLPWLIFLFMPSIVFAGSVQYTYDNRHRLIEVSYDNRMIFSYHYDAVGNRLMKEQYLDNSPPIRPHSPQPAHGATGLNIFSDIEISWLGGDPDSGDSVTYDLYFDTSSNPSLFKSNLSASELLMTGLDSFTNYYWKVVARDTSNATTEGPIWRFKTLDINTIDTDNDGLSDGAEINIYGTNRLVADTDGDGLKDGEECNYWGSKCTSDSDGDGKKNLLDADSDNDGAKDGDEVRAGSNPGSSQSIPDNNEEMFMFIFE